MGFSKLLFIVLGSLITGYGIILLISTNMNLGTVLVCLFGIALLAIGIFYGFFRERTPMWVTLVVAFLLVCEFTFISVLFIYGDHDNLSNREDVLIVLGSGIRGEEVSYGLKCRLDRAIEYKKVNPDAVILLSGGKGNDESIAESVAMQRYLVENGIEADDIITEETSTSTYLNFVNSKKLLDEYFSRDYTVAFCTSEYHVYRAGMIAESVGFTGITHCHSNTEWYVFFPSGMRETLAVLKHWVFGK